MRYIRKRFIEMYVHYEKISFDNVIITSNDFSLQNNFIENFLENAILYHDNKTLQHFINIADKDGRILNIKSCVKWPRQN